MVAVAHVPTLSRNLLSTSEPVEQLGKPLVYYKTKALGGGVPGEESLFFNFCPREGLVSVTNVRRTPSQAAALALAAKIAESMRIATTGQLKSYEARLQVKAKWHAVQWIDGPDTAATVLAMKTSA